MDPSSSNSNIELGTKAFPFKALDDPFRELSTLKTLGETGVSDKISLFLKFGSNLTIHTYEMPLLAIKTHITI